MVSEVCIFLLPPPPSGIIDKNTSVPPCCVLVVRLDNSNFFVIKLCLVSEISDIASTWYYIRSYCITIRTRQQTRDPENVYELCG